ncbi:Zn-dependent protease with chaperone function [Intrasporangium oryzae NRRL B-24470]|uniref:Zn-dependent protease with chaperone function n=1 Tax=Intrasporangium oryzae NRRL B-24470 TaxID=1386089 RepID=W9GBC6_9MICO|nr:M56 family metallopeptidase [Intrasporangium oryzae]EWT02128.1 Zn-dependent protease with chaperone function [Intrasporangium oryzae NRRL B-24470]
MAALAALILLAVALAWPVPRVMAGLTAFRRAPRPALVVWQATAVAAVLAALFAAPAAVPLFLDGSGPVDEQLIPVAVAALLSGIVAARLLLSGHRVGTNLRAVRRQHRELVDLLAVHGDTQVRVLEHPTPTAYCVPGIQRRVVLTQGTIDTLPGRELDAVLAHERAHLVARHDLVMEFFTVVHEAVPRFMRSSAALREVNLLIEVLADRAAVRETSAVLTGRAIVRMAGGPKPAGTMAIREAPSAARVRLGLLDDEARIAGMPPALVSVGMYAFALSLVAMPFALLVGALTGVTAS